jgi:hypothetical protein
MRGHESVLMVAVIAVVVLRYRGDGGMSHAERDRDRLFARITTGERWAKTAMAISEDGRCS